MSTKLPTDYQTFIHLSRYARWLPEKNRREAWDETVKRYFDFFEEHLKDELKFDLSKDLRNKLENAVLELKVMPSMRALMSAGEALKRDNIAGYNCAYLAVDHPKSFSEILYILMNGTGVGFSVERQFVSLLPNIPEEMFETDTTIVVRDSKLGWAKAFKELLTLLYSGQIPKWDLSLIRSAGSPLKTFGGRASGPGPLDELFKFTVKTFNHAKGRKLQSIECHDIVCKTAEIVVVGGVRRSALISLSNLSDDRMRSAKSGQWWETNPQRALANNSACYTEKPDVGVFMDEWKSLYESKSGERGIFNRQAAQKQAAKYGRRESNHHFGTNPCSEILLKSREFCNLSEVVVRSEDTYEILKEKVELATIIGTFQSTLTNFKFISSEYKNNCEDERLLGVSLTGIMDNKLLSTPGKDLQKLLSDLREHALLVNKKWADILGINQSVSITCVKPSGTVSQLVDAASGIHARHASQYIRTVRADIRDPLCNLMKDGGFYWEPCAMKPEHTCVFYFPIKAPEGCITRESLTAVEQLSLWLDYQNFWCEHKPSVTITVKEDEWFEVGAFVYKNFDNMSGVSFLPFSDHTYKQAPYTDATLDEINQLEDKQPKNFDWSKISEYEKIDSTTGTQEYACTGNSCEVVDIISKIS